MPKTKSTKAKKTIRLGGEHLYEAFSSKIAISKFKKKVADPACKSHVALVAQVLVKEFDRPAGFEQLLAAVKATGRYKTEGDMAGLVRGDLGILVRDGLVKAVRVAEK